MKTFEVNGIKYEINSDGISVTVIRSAYSGIVIIPPQVQYLNNIYRVTTIGDWAFEGCSGIISLTIPDSVTSIGDYAFFSCIGITSLTIPDSVTSIGDWAFEGCYGITSLTIPESVTSIGDWAFSVCDGIASLTIPDSVTSIGEWAFSFCYGITSLTIPESVTSIGNGAFAGCSDLERISVDNHNVNYDSRGDCNAIIETATNTLIAGCKNTTIPKSVTSIGDSSFYGCSGITSLTIPDSVTVIGNDAFAECDALTEIKSFAIVPPACGNLAFDNINKEECILYVPKGQIDAYKQAEEWKDFVCIKEM